MPESASEPVVKVTPSAPTAPKTDTEKKANLDAMTAMLNHVEAQMLSGAPNLTPKDVLLDLKDLQDKHPDKHFRWVNIRTPGVADRRRLMGYIRVPESEGGRELGGEVAVFVTTKKLHERAEQKIKEDNAARLSAHKAEVYEAAERVVREMRDKHGLKINLDRILVQD